VKVSTQSQLRSNWYSKKER